MKFKYTILYVKDVKTTLGFYEQAFGMAQKMLSDDGGYGELDTGDTSLAFASLDAINEMIASKSPMQANPKTPVFEIAFETDDVSAALAKAVQAGATMVQEATKMPWGQTVGYVSDPDGFLIELCTEVNP